MRKNKKGFTLIEILLVIAIMGILTMLGLSSFMGSLQKGRDSKRKNDLRQVKSALEMYFADKERYPASDPITNEIVGASWGAPFTDGTSLYMAQLPKDPIEGQHYYYVSDATGTYFQLYARLENTKDSDIPHDGTTPGTYSNTTCGSTCDYGVSSTNVLVTQDHSIQYEEAVYP